MPADRTYAPLPTNPARARAGRAAVVEPRRDDRERRARHDRREVGRRAGEADLDRLSRRPSARRSPDRTTGRSGTPRRPTTSAMSEASGDGRFGSMIRSQLRTTSAPLSGEPSENVSPGRRWKTIRRPPSRIDHDSASAGRTARLGSIAVRLSNSWALTRALAMSPWSAGSSSAGVPVRIDTSSRPAARALPPPTSAGAPRAVARTRTSAASTAERRPTERRRGSRPPERRMAGVYPLRVWEAAGALPAGQQVVPVRTGARAGRSRVAPAPRSALALVGRSSPRAAGGPGQCHRPANGAPVAFLAQHEAPPDRERLERPEPLVERAPGDEVVAPEGDQPRADRVDVARRCVLPPPEIGGHEAAVADDGHGRIGQRIDERRRGRALLEPSPRRASRRRSRPPAGCPRWPPPRAPGRQRAKRPRRRRSAGRGPHRRRTRRSAACRRVRTWRDRRGTARWSPRRPSRRPSRRP